ncbi:MAG TPA: histidine phosphatase family protein, partial [Clostridia bacterium]|nr:histidine phosphatase family protein [Clostridia bacterium]
MTTTWLILVRHAQTASNGADPDPRMSGWTDLPLSPAGQRQGELLHRRFAFEPMADALYSSPLQRAQDTAAKLLHASRSPMCLLENLREIHCGEVDGLPISTVQKRYECFWKENLRQDNEHFRWPGGESYRELRERSVTAMEKIAALHAGQRVLVVTHAGVISQLVGALNSLNPARWEPFRPQNTS